jgi:hypothetical protein
MSVAGQLEVRELLVKRLRLDLLGPSSPDEVLRQDKESREGDTPLYRYLIGILYPTDSVVSAEEDDFANDGAEGEEDDAPETAIPIAGIPKPSSIGLSFAVSEDTKSIRVEFRYGLYIPSEESAKPKEADEEKKPDERKKKPTILWTRKQIAEEVTIDLPDPASKQRELPNGGRGEWLCRNDGGLRVVTVFLRNTNHAGTGPDEPEQCLYQPEITVRGGVAEAPIVNRAHRASKGAYDPDLESYRLLYRDKPEFAVGHGCATEWDWKDCPPNRARMVRTELLPTYVVSTTEARGGVGLPGLVMETLADATSGEAIAPLVEPLLEQYGQWIADRRKEVSTLPADLQPKAREHLDDCDEALRRMRDGLSLIAGDPLVFEAFRFANRAMLMQREKSVEALNYQKGKGRIFDADRPAWRPFQLAFILLNLRGIVTPNSADREIVDLLWFPTGGGKTEAYLGLAAFTMGLRRLRDATKKRPDASGDGGVTVLMRYTLRLLTIQQFQRAATLLCACEILRRQAPDRLGRQPFSIGLWVGGGATPNHIDQKPDPQYGREPGALQALENFDPKNEPAEGNPVQIRSCPWCGEAIAHTNYRASKELLHLQIRCPNEQCDFHGSATDLMSGIPAFAVDEDIYFRCPTMLIGTVDKIARLPWDERTKSLFGRVDRRCRRHDFLAEGVTYNECGSRHNAKPGFPATGIPDRAPRFLPPELIIQDELHLITGPLGSLMGLYEGAVDFLCSRSGHRPKVVASTATIRRYQDQIRGLFDRTARQFPPPGLIAGDSFFAAENKARPGRMYAGICAPGKSMKTAAVRMLASLMHTAERERLARPPEVVDPYWTLVYYFNSLRELGGALRLIDDDVRQRLIYLAHGDGIAPRKPESRPELTSRIPAREIPTRLKQMEQTLASGQALDVLLSTNMISVGVDIQRFGLMAVTGQPKTSAEYIQATSRVGRQTPGLICTLYNWSRPRDLSHYERFVTYHSMMYRHVEASSVTPYSPRARDKALHGIFISLLRLLDPRLSGNEGAQNFNRDDPLVREICDFLLERVRQNDPDEYEDARAQLQALIDGWVTMQARHGTDLRFRSPGGAGINSPVTWLMQSAEDGQTGDYPMGTLNSLRDVEKASGLYFKNFRRPGSARVNP